MTTAHRLTPSCLVTLFLCVGSVGEGAERVITFTAPEMSIEAPDKPHEGDPLTQLKRNPAVPPPGLGTANPRFLENGFRVEAFWAVDVGRRSGHFIRAHFHPKDLATGFEGQHYGWRTELHGLYIRAANGKPFSLKSLRYRVTRNRELPDRNTSLERFTLYDVSVLIGTFFDPTQPLLRQFVPFSAGPPVGNNPLFPFSTLVISGFDEVTQLFIASSASVDFDDIVLDDLTP